MARPKEFNRDEVLTKAMEVFWENGFEGTSMQDLLDRMGINRGSLYDTFGDKHSLYLEALDKYRQMNETVLLEVLQKKNSIREKLQEVFMRVVEDACSDGGFYGCFINNAMVERAFVDPKTALRTVATINIIENALEKALKSAIENGELRKELDTSSVARFLFANLQGLLVIAKNTREREKLEDIVRVTLSILR